MPLGHSKDTKHGDVLMYVKGIWHKFKKCWFCITLIACFSIAITLLFFMDYYNIEGYNYVYNDVANNFEKWYNPFFNQRFVFEMTWKGRAFYLVFLWLVIIETIIGSEKILEEKIKSRKAMLSSLIFALIPLIYIIAVNFFGLDLTILKIGHSLGIRSITPEKTPWDFLYFHWPLSCEYFIFAISFICAIILAYKTLGLKSFSISAVFLLGISIVYMLDTIYPHGVFKPFQAFVLPTAATAAAFFDLLGYRTILTFPVKYMDSKLTSLTVIGNGGKSASVAIAWACAGVHSLLLYVLIILVFFKRIDASVLRKTIYFVVGLFGTYFVNVLRIFSIVLVMLKYGRDAGYTFHDIYGELYFFTWIFLYIALIAAIQRFMLVERVRNILRKIGLLLKTVQSKITSRFKASETQN